MSWASFLDTPPTWSYDHVTCSLANEWKGGPLTVPFALDDQCSPMMPPHRERDSAPLHSDNKPFNIFKL